ncbi:MAG: hypothetical protein K8I82_03495 [Anaerolineae bacterium]|nr:hypothetical protein [Anaerolineae bacterium]
MSTATRTVKSDWLRLVELKMKRIQLEGVLAQKTEPDTQPDSPVIETHSRESSRLIRASSALL